MPDEPKDYPTANGAPEETRFFCPFGAHYQSGPAATWVKKLPLCDVKNCAVGHGATDLCSFLHICNMLDQLGGCVLQLRPAIEKLAPYLKQLSDRLDHHNRTLDTILLALVEAKTK